MSNACDIFYSVELEIQDDGSCHYEPVHYTSNYLNAVGYIIFRNITLNNGHLEYYHVKKFKYDTKTETFNCIETRSMMGEYMTLLNGSEVKEKFDKFIADGANGCERITFKIGVYNDIFLNHFNFDLECSYQRGRDDEELNFTLFDEDGKDCVYSRYQKTCDKVELPYYLRFRLNCLSNRLYEDTRKSFTNSKFGTRVS